MKTLYLLALIAFVLAVGSAIPNEEKAEALDNALYVELKEIASDLSVEDTASVVVDEEVEEDEESEEDEEDEEDEDNDDDELNEDADENADEEDEEDEDSDEEDEADENGISLPSSSVQKSSDPTFRLVGRVVRGACRVVRRFRRRRGECPERGRRRPRVRSRRRRRFGCD